MFTTAAVDRHWVFRVMTRRELEHGNWSKVPGRTGRSHHNAAFRSISELKSPCKLEEMFRDFTWSAWAGVRYLSEGGSIATGYSVPERGKEF